MASVVRPALVLPESMGVLEALRRLQARRQQLALVADEYGGRLEVLAVQRHAITHLRLVPPARNTNGGKDTASS